MGEATRPPMDDIKVINQYLKLEKLVSSYRPEYMRIFDRLLADFDVDEDFIAQDVQGRMRTFAQLIQNNFDDLSNFPRLDEELTANAVTAYLGKKVNVPESATTQLSPEQRVFTNVRDRIESLGICIDELSDSFLQTREELAAGKPIDQETFDDAREVCGDLHRALISLARDFPPLFSSHDRTELAKVPMKKPMHRHLHR